MAKQLVMIISLLTLIAGCDKSLVGDCFVKRGSVKTESRFFDQSFNSIQCHDMVDVVIVPDSTHYVEVTAGENLLADVTTKIEGDFLIIDKESNCNWTRKFKKPTVYVHLPMVRTIEYRGNGTITANGRLKGDTLSIHIWMGGEKIDLSVEYERVETYHHSGTTDVILNGKAGDLSCYKHSMGKLKLFGLQTSNGYIDSKSSTDAELWVTDKLDYKINFEGDVLLKGDPQVNKIEQNGNGKLIRK
ncbi:GIN domain-containing protein [Salibacter halophilus]|uniref:DUF2807 domain-containing protein n=1 Tax=Salibacter halophilus TaxID=1803916 RepID=A0A6N6M406_9FLAO|nr:DUF2807 domain-containing protein [Salibacter halophilus]KAB1062133.1 DUF2807 domain-containing protein [Salibacter halophilus]